MLKPNLAQDSNNSVSADFVEAILKFVQENKNPVTEVFIAEGADGIETEELFESQGYKKLAEKYDVGLIDLNTTETQEVISEEFITIDDFMKVQLKVAEVISADRVEKSEKLLKLKIALENEERQIVAGIAKSHSPEDLIGKKVMIVANLKPAKLMGHESMGMILALEREPGIHEVLMVNSTIKSGTRAK